MKYFKGEIDQMRTWLMARLDWIDSQWLNNGNCTNQAPTDIVLSNNSIAEKMAPGTLVGNITVIDSDDTEHSVVLRGGPGATDNDKFTIDGDQLLSLQTFDLTLY